MFLYGHRRREAASNQSRCFARSALIAIKCGGQAGSAPRYATNWHDAASCVANVNSALAAVAQHELEAEIDAALAAALERQRRRSAADRIAMHADGGKFWRDQPPHFEITKPDKRHRLLGRRPIAQQSGRTQAGHKADRMRIIGREY